MEDLYAAAQKDAQDRAQRNEKERQLLLRFKTEQFGKLFQERVGRQASIVLDQDGEPCTWIDGMKFRRKTWISEDDELTEALEVYYPIGVASYAGADVVRYEDGVPYTMRRAYVRGLADLVKPLEATRAAFAAGQTAVTNHQKRLDRRERQARLCLRLGVASWVFFLSGMAALAALWPHAPPGDTPALGILPAIGVASGFVLMGGQVALWMWLRRARPLRGAKKWSCAIFLLLPTWYFFGLFILIWKLIKWRLG